MYIITPNIAQLFVKQYNSIFVKYFVKSICMYFVDFTEFFFKIHFDNVGKRKIYSSSHGKIFRQINSLVTSLVKSKNVDLTEKM